MGTHSEKKPRSRRGRATKSETYRSNESGYQLNFGLAAGLFVAAQVGYTLAAAVYDSMLVEVAGPLHVGGASGFGRA